MYSTRYRTKFSTRCLLNLVSKYADVTTRTKFRSTFRYYLVVLQSTILPYVLFYPKLRLDLLLAHVYVSVWHDSRCSEAELATTLQDAGWTPPRCACTVHCHAYTGGEVLAGEIGTPIATKLGTADLLSAQVKSAPMKTTAT